MPLLPRCLAFCLAAAFCRASGDIAADQAACAGAACAAASGQDPVALMQLQSTVKRGGINAGKGSVVPEATPVGRTLISTNPGQSAKFVLDYFDAKEVQVPSPGESTSSDLFQAAREDPPASSPMRPVSAVARLERARPLWWFHVPKCGSSLGNALVHLPGMCLPSLPEDYIMELPGNFEIDYPASEYCPGSFVTQGRFSAGDHSALGVSPQWLTKGHSITMLRQPEQRIISAWFDDYHSWPYWYYQRWPVDILEFAKVVSGCQVRMLVRNIASPSSASKEHTQPSACGSLVPATGAETSLAKETLRESFVYVGITEEWDLSICLLHAVFGGNCLASDFVDSNPGNNATSSGYDISVLNGYQDLHDGAVYTEARAMFHEQMLRYGVSQETCQLCFRQATSLGDPPELPTALVLESEGSQRQQHELQEEHPIVPIGHAYFNRP